MIDEKCPACGVVIVCDDLYSEPKQQSEGKKRPEGSDTQTLQKAMTVERKTTSGKMG